LLAGPVCLAKEKDNSATAFGEVACPATHAVTAVKTAKKTNNRFMTASS
jgi:hypothetical protein